MLHKMSQPQKAPLLKKNDLITELPDEIISQFISLLPFKEAVRTSILSKSWISIWTTHMDVVCNDRNILGYLSDESRYSAFLRRQDQTNKFVERLDGIMQKRCKGPKLNSINISFPLSQEHESHITSWITGAVMMGVEKIKLNLEGGHVKFKDVNFTDQQFDFMLCNCLLLERLVVENCNDLVNFRLTSRSSRLKFLAIRSCCRLNSFELYAENLEILEYTGELERFLFKNVPNLAEIFFRFSGTSHVRRRVRRVTYAPSRITNDVPRLEVLNMFLIQLISLPEGVPTLINIKHLVLTVIPFQDKDMLGWVAYILKAAPLLTNLQFNKFISTRRSEDSDELLPEVTHANLTKLEINGYRGKQHEKEIVKYLFDSAVKLDLLVISPQVKFYKGLNSWYRSESNSFDKKLSSEQIEELHFIVPKAVRVKYSD